MGCWGGAWCAEDSRWVGRVRSLVPVETPKQNESLKAEEKTGWEHMIRTCVGESSVLANPVAPRNPEPQLEQRGDASASEETRY